MKKVVSLLLTLMMIFSVLPSYVNAEKNSKESGVVFYNAVDDTVIKNLNDVETMYAEVTFKTENESIASILVASYDENGAFLGIDVLEYLYDIVDATTTYTTSEFSVEDAEVIKVFAFNSMGVLKPLLDEPGVIETIVEVPKASIEVLDVTKIEDVVLSSALNFKADEISEEQLEEYGDWYTDFVLTVNKDMVIEGKTVIHSYNFVITATKTDIAKPELVATSYMDGLCVASSYGGTWSGAAPVLEGVSIKYWSVAESKYKTINLSDYTPKTAGKQNGTNTQWTYSPENKDFTLTITGGLVHSSNKIYAMPVVCDGKLYFVASASKGLVNSGNTARSIPVSYVFEDNNGGKLEFSHSWSVAENKDAQYKYSDFCDGKLTQLTSGGGSGSCITEDTLITLADGTQKEVKYLNGDEELLVWNLETGSYDVAPIVFIDSEEELEDEVVNLYFSDGSNVGVIYEHGFFDVESGKYVYINKENAVEYIGHKFVKQSDVKNNEWETVTLLDVVVENKVTVPYSPVTFEHLCYYTNGILSMPGGIEGLFNIFEVDTDVMAYDAEKMAADIDEYGLFTYSDFEGVVSEVAYEAFNGDVLKVAIGKGMLDWNIIEALAERYMPLVSQK